MLRRIFGTNGTRERGPFLQELRDERRAVEKAMARATETGEPQIVNVGQERFVVADPKHTGREIKPAG